MVVHTWSCPGSFKKIVFPQKIYTHKQRLPNPGVLTYFLLSWYILRRIEICAHCCGYYDEGMVAYWLGLLLAISESHQSKQKGQLIYAHLISLLCKGTAKIQ